MLTLFYIIIGVPLTIVALGVILNSPEIIILIIIAAIIAFLFN